MFYRFTYAIVRLPAPTYHLGLTTQDPGRGDYDRFLRHYETYVAALERAGLSVRTLEALADFPDAHFVEDVAGTVYVRVPARGEGRGQVRVVVNGRQRIFNAISEGGAVESKTHVRVTRVNSFNIVLDLIFGPQRHSRRGKKPVCSSCRPSPFALQPNNKIIQFLKRQILVFEQ